MVKDNTMSKDEIIGLITKSYGKITTKTEKFIEVEYCLVKNKFDVEKILYINNVPVLQGSSSDIGNSLKVHRIYYEPI